jgi:hypothetical protein
VNLLPLNDWSTLYDSFIAIHPAAAWPGYPVEWCRAPNSLKNKNGAEIIPPHSLVVVVFRGMAVWPSPTGAFFIRAWQIHLSSKMIGNFLNPSFIGDDTSCPCVFYE